MFEHLLSVPFTLIYLEVDLLDVFVLIVGFPDPAVVFQEAGLPLAVLDHLAGTHAPGCNTTRRDEETVKYLMINIQHCCIVW